MAEDKGAPKPGAQPQASVVPRPAGSSPRPVTEALQPKSDVAAPLKKPPPPITSKAPPPPIPQSAPEIDDADLLSDGWEAPPSSRAKPAPVVEKPVEAPPLNPFLPADSQPHQPVARAPTASTESVSLAQPEEVAAEPAPTTSTESVSPPLFGEPEDTTPAAEPAEPADVRAPSKAPPSVPKKRSRAWVIAFLLAAVTVGGVFAYRAKSKQDEQRRAATFSKIPDPPDEPPTPSSSVEPAPPPTYTSPPPEKSADASAKTAGHPAVAASVPPGQSGILDTSALPAGRKIIVNGRVIGFSPQRVTVRCGTVRVQIGDLPTESISLPCGGEVSFTD